MTQPLKHWVRFLPQGGGSLSAGADAIEAKFSRETELRDRRKALAAELSALDSEIKALEKEINGDTERLTLEAERVFDPLIVGDAKDCAYWQLRRGQNNQAA